MKSTISSAMMSPVIPIPPNLPVGYKFDPEDKELIGYYLVMLLHGFYSHDMPIGVVNFLEHEPWELPARSRIDSDQVWYFFCKRVFYTDRKKRMFKRKTQVGHWKPTSESTNIDDLGKRSTLRFYKDSPKVEKTEWIAYEYEIKQNSTLSNPDEFVIIKMMNFSGEKRTKIKAKMSKQKSRLMSTSTNDQNQSLDEVMTISDCSYQVPADFGNQDVGNTTFSISNQSNQMASACEMMNIGSCNGHEVVPSDFEYQNTVEMSAISTHDAGEPSSRATSSCQNHSSITEVQECGYFSMRRENQEEYEHSNCLFASDLENQKLPSEAADTPLKMTPCSHEIFADFGNQIGANTTVTSTYSMPQQCIQKDTALKVMDTISYGSYVVSSDYGHENPEEMAVMSSYDIGESSSQANSGCQNHSSVTLLQEHGYFHTRVSPYIHENQEDCILSSDFENQNLPSEVEDCPPKATPYTENQFTPDQTNLSCSMTSRLEDHFQNPEFNSSFLKDGDFSSRIDFDPQVLAELNAFHELLYCLSPKMQQATCLDQCM